jgi:Tfp pilus assembly protein PilO
MTKTKTWSVATVLVVLAVLEGSWFLVIGPKQREASRLRDDAVAQDESNQRLQAKIAMLKAQSKDLPKQQARLAQIRVNIPANPQLPKLIRDLSSSADKSGVDLVSLAPSQPAAMQATAPTSTPAAPSASGTAATPTLMQIPLVVTANGDYFEVEQFLNKIEGLKRSFLVTGLTLGAADGAEAKPGDVKLTVNGRVFMSPPVAAGTTATGVTAPGTTSAAPSASSASAN